MPGPTEGRRLLAAVALLGLMACSRPGAVPPRGLAGLDFGAPPGPGLVRVMTALPSGLAGVLAYYRRSGPAEAFLGVALADPVYAFARNRLFSVSATLSEPDGAVRLRRELTAGFGDPLCRRRDGRQSCLWRLSAVDVVVESGAGAPARCLVRHRELAAPVQAYRGQDVPLPTRPDTP